MILQSPLGSEISSPLPPCRLPEYLMGPYKSADYEYMSTTPSQECVQCTDDESSGPSTAEIIANQSQDYVDEKLAEYQAIIQHLQGK